LRKTGRATSPPSQQLARLTTDNDKKRRPITGGCPVQRSNRTDNPAKNTRIAVLGKHSRPGHRRHEQGTIPARRDRFFSVSNKWYFSTREGFDSGPYATRDRAATGLQRFLDVVRLLPDGARQSR